MKTLEMSMNHSWKFIDIYWICMKNHRYLYIVHESCWYCLTKCWHFFARDFDNLGWSEGVSRPTRGSFEDAPRLCIKTIRMIFCHCFHIYWWIQNRSGSIWRPCWTSLRFFSVENRCESPGIVQIISTLKIHAQYPTHDDWQDFLSAMSGGEILKRSKYMS